MDSAESKIKGEHNIIASAAAQQNEQLSQANRIHTAALRLPADGRQAWNVFNSFITLVADGNRVHEPFCFLF